MSADTAPSPLLTFVKDLATDLCSLALTTLQLLFLSIVLLVCIAMAAIDELKPLERLKPFVLFLEDTIVAFGDESYKAVASFDHDAIKAFKNKAVEALKRGFKVAVFHLPCATYYLLAAALCAVFGGVRLFLLLAAWRCCVFGLMEGPGVRAWSKDTGVTDWLDGWVEDWFGDVGEVRVEDGSAVRLESFLMFVDSNMEAFEGEAYGALRRVWMAAVHDAPNLIICVLFAVLCRLAGMGLLYFLLVTVVFCCTMSHLREVQRNSTEDTSTDGDGDGNGDDSYDEESSEGRWPDDICIWADDSDDDTDSDDDDEEEIRWTDYGDDDTEGEGVDDEEESMEGRGTDDGDDDTDGNASEDGGTDDDEEEEEVAAANIENRSTSEEEWCMV